MLLWLRSYCVRIAINNFGVIGNVAAKIVVIINEGDR